MNSLETMHGNKQPQGKESGILPALILLPHTIPDTTFKNFQAINLTFGMLWECMGERGKTPHFWGSL